MIAIELPKIEYLPVMTTRRLSVEFPYADPFAGVPFRQKNGPAIAIVGAAGTIGAGVAAWSAGATLVGGLMIAGGVMSALGAITGNETLSTLGMGLSLAGGIGTAFVDTAGNFVNPFTSAEGFSGTMMGSTFKNIKTDLFGGGASSADQLGIGGDSIVNAATETIDTSAGAMTQGIIDAAPKTGIDLLKATSSVPGAANAASGGGMLSQLMNNQGVLGAVGGMADNYMKQQEIDAAEPLRDAQISNYKVNADATQAQTDLLQDRYNNMQNQPEVGLGVNQNAQVFGNQPGTAQGKIAVVMNGEVKYLTQQEYDAVRQAQQSGGGGGMLAAGAA
jgi:hypothetical protein